MCVCVRERERERKSGDHSLNAGALGGKMATVKKDGPVTAKDSEKELW